MAAFNSLIPKADRIKSTQLSLGDEPMRRLPLYLHNIIIPWRF